MKNAEYKTESLQAIIDAIVAYCNSQKGAHQSALTDINDEDCFQYLTEAFTKRNISPGAWAVYTTARDEIARRNREVDKKTTTSSEPPSPDAELDESISSVISCESFMANQELTGAQKRDITLYAIAYHYATHLIESPHIKTELCRAYQDAFLLKFMMMYREKKIVSDDQLECAPSVAVIAKPDLVKSIKNPLEELFSFKLQGTVIVNALDEICEAEGHQASSDDGLSNGTPTNATEKREHTQADILDAEINDLIDSVVMSDNDESLEGSHNESTLEGVAQTDNRGEDASQPNGASPLTPAARSDVNSDEEFSDQFAYAIRRAIDTSPPNESIQNIFRKVSSVAETDWEGLHRFISSQEGEERFIEYLKNHSHFHQEELLLKKPPEDLAITGQRQTRPLISRYYVAVILLSCALVLGVIAAALIIPPCLVSLVGAQAMVDTGISLLATSCGGLVAAGGSALVTHYTDGHKADL